MQEYLKIYVNCMDLPGYDLNNPASHAGAQEMIERLKEKQGTLSSPTLKE